MVTETQPKRQATVVKSPVHLSTYHQGMLGQLLGIDRRDRGPALERLREVLAENHACLRGAPLTPTRAHHVAAFAKVQKDAQRLYQTIDGLPAHHREQLPDVGVFAGQLAKFHDEVQIGLFQMRGRGSARGGAKKQAIAGARQMVQFSLSMFFDLNAHAPNGSPWTVEAKVTDAAFARDRQHFIEYCLGLIDPSGA